MPNSTHIHTQDILAQDIVLLMQGSKSKIFQSLFEEAAPAGGAKVGAKKSGGVAHASVSSVFKKDLQVTTFAFLTSICLFDHTDSRLEL